MKKQKLKLQLKKHNVSDLNNLKGGKKNITDIDSDWGLCGDTHTGHTILQNATCGAYCGYETWEVYSCGHSKCCG